MRLERKIGVAFRDPWPPLRCEFRNDIRGGKPSRRIVDRIWRAIGWTEIMRHLMDERRNLAVTGDEAIRHQDQDLVFWKKDVTAVLSLRLVHFPSQVDPVRKGQGQGPAGQGLREIESSGSGNEGVLEAAKIAMNESKHVAEHASDQFKVLGGVLVLVQGEVLIHQG